MLSLRSIQWAGCVNTRTQSNEERETRKTKIIFEFIWLHTTLNVGMYSGNAVLFLSINFRIVLIFLVFFSFFLSFLYLLLCVSYVVRFLWLFSFQMSNSQTKFQFKSIYLFFFFSVKTFAFLFTVCFVKSDVQQKCMCFTLVQTISMYKRWWWRWRRLKQKYTKFTWTK